MECPMPTINTNDIKEIKKIFDEVQSIAIIGLSPDESKDSNKVARYLQQEGFKIIPVYPKEETILGEKVYRSLSEIDERVDMVDMFRKPAIADSLLEEILKRDDVKVFWLQLGIVNNEACEKAKAAGLTVVQNKCSKVEHQRLAV
ncbi:CoA-binding protein [Sulfurospirillum sp. 1612]|uniref:CoA-binding protein n=1 Tax=Sulfurospirillum sp. 1612 TaxID=3094835 RepID=UPI002F93FF87